MDKFNLLTGRAGSGKSLRLFKEIKESLASGRDHWRVLLVPDQFTLQTERDLLHYLQTPGLMDVEVLGFSRLVQRLQEESGQSHLNVLDEHGRRMLLKGASEEVADQLLAFSASYQRVGFLQKIDATIGSARAFGVTSGQFAHAAGRPEVPKSMAEKLHDVALVWQRAQENAGDELMSSEDLLEIVGEAMPRCPSLAGAIVWVDGFTSFSRKEAEFLADLALQVERVTCALTFDDTPGRSDGYVFRPAAQGIAFFTEALTTRGLAIQRQQLEPGEDAPSGIKAAGFLEKQLFNLPLQPSSQQISGIRFVVARNPEIEVEDLACQIVRYVQNSGGRWQDISVVCADADRYNGIIQRIFPMYRIPFFLDARRGLLHNSAVRFLIGSMEAALGRLSGEQVISVLKTGLAGMEREEISFFENYCLARGIRYRSHWDKDWSLGASEADRRGESLKQEYLAPLLKLHKAFHVKAAKTGMPLLKISDLILRYLQQMNFEQRIKDYVQELQQQTFYDEAAEFAQIPQVIEELLGQAALAGGDCLVSTRDFLALLLAGLTGKEVGIIPASSDCVAVGDLVRSRSRRAAAVFILGANDGNFPKSPENVTVFGDAEIEALTAFGLPMGLSDDETVKQVFGIYASIARSMDFLSISYAQADEAGKALRPSYFYHQMRQLLPRSPEVTAVEIWQRPLADQVAPIPSLYAAAQKLREFNLQGTAALQGEDWHGLVEHYLDVPDWALFAQSCQDGAKYSNLQRRLQPEVAAKLFPSPIVTYASRLELFCQCPFAHLVKYGLRPKDREVHELKAGSIGNIFHQVLAQAGQEMCQAARNGDAEFYLSHLRQRMERQLDAFQNGIFIESNLGQWQRERILEAAAVIGQGLYGHIAAGFTPKMFEARFGSQTDSVLPGLTFSQGDLSVVIEGAIDRVDTWQAGSGGPEYARVIDYKSGQIKKGLGMMLEGLQLQLPLYLAALRGHYRLAGMFYSPLVDAIQEVADETQSVNLSEQLKMEGYALNDAQVLAEMDPQLVSAEGKGTSSLINLKTGKTPSSNLLAPPQMEKLLSLVLDKVATTAGAIRRGECSASPYKMAQETACRFCDYRSLCQFDPRMPDNQFRQLQRREDKNLVGILDGGDHNE